MLDQEELGSNADGMTWQIIKRYTRFFTYFLSDMIDQREAFSQSNAGINQSFDVRSYELGMLYFLLTGNEALKNIRDSSL